MPGQVRSPIEQAVLTGLVVSAAAILVLKLLTGLSLMPLFIVFLLVFGIASILRLRLLRMPPSR
jgi:hypothetical protein